VILGFLVILPIDLHPTVSSTQKGGFSAPPIETAKIPYFGVHITRISNPFFLSSLTPAMVDSRSGLSRRSTPKLSNWPKVSPLHSPLPTRPALIPDLRMTHSQTKKWLDINCSSPDHFLQSPESPTNGLATIVELGGPSHLLNTVWKPSQALRKSHFPFHAPLKPQFHFTAFPDWQILFAPFPP